MLERTGRLSCCPLSDRGYYWWQGDFPTLKKDDFAYIRWLGDRKGIEEQTKVWNQVITDREGELQEWLLFIEKLLSRRIMAMGYWNNHYAGFAPGSIDLLMCRWKRFEAQSE